VEDGVFGNKFSANGSSNLGYTYELPESLLKDTEEA
jgi:hypothetical protein